MTATEPGDKFRVSYGNEKTVDVCSLNLRAKRKLTDLMLQIQKNEEGANPFALIESALTMCMPDISDELIDSLDDVSAMEIITKTLEGQSLDNDGKKKSESQP